MRTAAKINAELIAAKVARAQHGPSSRMRRLLDERVKTLSKELALTTGALALGAL